MINYLRLQNFKAFENLLIEFKSLTLISGLNSTGKSSILQALSLLHQSYKQGLLQQNTGLMLNGNSVNIGRASDALYENATENYIEFELGLNDGIKGSWRFNYESANREDCILDMASQSVNADIYLSSIFSGEFYHLQSERATIQSGILEYQRQGLKNIGAFGEYTAHFLYTYGNQIISNANLSHPKAKSMNLIDQVEAWLREINFGICIQPKTHLDMDIVRLEFTDHYLNNKKIKIQYAITYILPIIVAVLSSNPGALILIEHPETSLHPQVQTKLGKLLSLAANDGVQVIVETHSDHVLNGIRLAVHGRKIKPEDVQLQYLQLQETGTHQFITELLSPRIDKHGRIDRWPDGFFDQYENDLTVLL
jgi:predicted ATPase